MNILRRKILAVVLMLFVGFSLFGSSGCMTMKGLASDVEEISGAINKSLESAEESRRQARLDRASQLILKNKRNIETAR